jgi:DNA polymerase-3 subunit gamma/tau
MAKAKPAPKSEAASDRTAGEYTVVARRYRPQQFVDLIGQEHVASALVNALQSNRVAHAYLFTGARGVGKTSAARILAKALNCVKGPTPTPCDECDSCKAIAVGEDVDVLEIDGASNNKVDEVRELRQNAGFRPTRSRYKIYIIDEVHMLSTSAFNALLKTLEEPPEHVKFILATTEVQKIPITILSRCQRFDFAHVGPAKIFDQLKHIVAREGLQAEDDALRLIARRAGGSMRDSQSLLDQLLSSATGKLTAEQVNAVLGTAGDERVSELAAAILARDPKAALDLIAGWVERGLQIGELVDQLTGYWRALMLVSCGGPDVRELPVTPSQKAALATQAAQTTLDAILAGLEVWTATRARMRDTPHAQVLLEMAVVRLCHMGELLSIGQLAQALGQGVSLTGPAGRHAVAGPQAQSGAKKNVPITGADGVNGSGTSAENSTLELTESTLREVWQRLIRYLGEKSPILANHLKLASSPAIFGPNSLAIPFHHEYNHAREACSTDGNTRRIAEALAHLTGRPVTVRFDLAAGPPTIPRPVAPGQPADRKKQLGSLPLFKRAGEVLGAQIWHVDEEFNPAAAPHRAEEGQANDEDDGEANPNPEPDEA